MELAIRDHSIYQMKAEIENRKKLLCVKRRELQKTSKENKFLNGVLEDYNKYHNYIVENKKKQIMQFQMILDYIDSITKDLKLTDNQVTQATKDQKNILHELNKIKKDLDELTINL